MPDATVGAIDVTEETTGQVPTATTGQAPITTPLGATATGQASASAAPTNAELGPDGKPFDMARAMETIKQLRQTEKQAAAQTKELEALRATVKQHEDEKLSKEERLEKQVAELEARGLDAETRIADTLKRAEFRIAALQAGAIDIDAAFVLADLTDVTVDVKGGTVSGVQESMTRLKAAKPYLFQAPAQAATGATPQGRALETFNPGPGGRAAETDAQVLQRLRGAQGQNATPFGPRR